VRYDSLEFFQEKVPRPSRFMRKVLSSLLVFPSVFLTLSFAFSSSVWARGIVGINLACRLGDFERAARMVGSGNWVTVMAGPGNCDELQQIYDANQSYGVNIVIRAYNGGAAFTESDAIAWAATLGSLNTHGQRIYFMPWNEPNHDTESGGLGTTSAADAVVRYIKELKRYLSDAGLRNPGDKVALLSPMIDQRAANFDEFISALGGGSFYNQFDGIALNLYDQEGCACDSNPRANAAKFKEVLAGIGAPTSKPIFAVEVGIVYTGVSIPRYYDADLYSFFDNVVGDWNSDGDFRMFSVFSYDPHYSSGGWNIFSSQTGDFLNNYGHTHGGGGPDGYSSFDEGRFASWRDSQGLSSCDSCGWSPSTASCIDCWATSSFVEGPVGYLDQFTAYGKSEIGPRERRWDCWAPCDTPSGACNPPEEKPPSCEDALNKLGFPLPESAGSLVYPHIQAEYFDYLRDVYPGILSPEEVSELDTVLSSNLEAPGWVEFESAGGEVGGDSRTQITHPRAYLFSNGVGAKIEAISRALWKHLTPPSLQSARPMMVKGGRSRLGCWDLDGSGDVIPGCEDAGGTSVDYGGSLEHLPGLFAGDYAEGDYYGEPIGGCAACPPTCSASKGDKCLCGSELYKYKSGTWVHIGPEERIFERVINAERDESGKPRTFESLNPGWQALAETWNSLAGPVGFFRQLFYTPDSDSAVLSEAEDLFDPQPQVWPEPREVYKSQMYANTQFKYKYGPWSYPSGSNGMEVVKNCDASGNCWSCDVTQDNPDGVCRAHFPFWGGLRLVKDFVCRNLTEEGGTRETLCPDY